MKRVWWTMLVLVACRATPSSSPTDANAAGGLAELAEKIAPAIVTIHAGDRDGEVHPTGAGFIVGADGLIATCHHVIGEGRPITVELADGRRFDVTMVRAFDRARDVALLRIPATDLPTVEVGDDTALRQGVPVLAFGHPLGFEKSVAAGVIAALREVDGRSLIQLSMPIEPGNSGGPVVDHNGRVLGLVTMKSIVKSNLGFAVPVSVLRNIHERPNPVPMSRWLTIGALDDTKWSSLFGARWRQRAGRIVVDRPGRGMAGRSLLLSTREVPDRPYVVGARVKLGSAEGAAGIAFGSDGGDVHYAFYPTRGRLRLTRFEGPDVYSWRVLFDQPSPHFRPRSWNHLEVRHEAGRIRCFVNDHLVAEVKEQTLPSGRVGYVKFRNTAAEMKQLEVRTTKSKPKRSESERLLSKARDLEWEATRLRADAKSVHQTETIGAIVAALNDEPPKLLHATLLVSKLDNADVDIDAYVAEVDRMAKEIALRVPPGASPSARLSALSQYLFDENGFHGSRDEYLHRNNSYLNEVIDDREGLPITLSILYLELAHRLGLPVFGVGLPGHFVVRYQDQLFDPFDGGRRMPMTEAGRLVRRHRGRPAWNEDLAPSTPRAIVVRVLRNLLKAARRGNDGAGQLRYLDAILAVDPTAARERQHRGQLRLRTGENRGAAEDFERLLLDAPDGIDLDEVQRWLKLIP